MLLSEANQWPEDAAAYFRQRRRIAHEFSLSPHAAHVHGAADGGPFSHHRYPGTDSVDSEQCQWAMFLRNHDELTLENGH